MTRLQAQERKNLKRRRILTGGLAAGLLLLSIVLWGIYSATVGAYAVLGEVEVRQHPVYQGRLLVSYLVQSPGKVYSRRTSGRIEGEVLDYFSSPAEVRRPWSWDYRPGRNIDVEICYRRGLFLQSYAVTFPTRGRADVVFLLDTTGPIQPSIEQLEDKTPLFTAELQKHALEHRLALVGFGNSRESPWLDRHEFTYDARHFLRGLSKLKRLGGGQFRGSPLDALDEALHLPLDPGAIRRFYLVTGANCGDATRSGATAAHIATRLWEQQVVLHVFSQPEFEADYAKLLGEVGTFRGIEDFGEVLGQGRVLDD